MSNEMSSCKISLAVMYCPGCHTRNGSIFTIISSVAVFRIFVQCWGRQMTGMLALTDLDSPITTQVYGSHASGIHSNDFFIRVERMERKRNPSQTGSV
jgi:hypothetical protein